MMMTMMVMMMMRMMIMTIKTSNDHDVEGDSDDDDGGCGRAQYPVVIFWMVHKGKVTFFHHMDLIEPRDPALAVAGKSGSVRLGNRPYGNGFLEFHDQDFTRSE